MQFDIQNLNASQKKKLTKAISQYLEIQDEYNKGVPLDKNTNFQKAFTDLYRLDKGSWNNQVIMRPIFFKCFEMYRMCSNKKVSISYLDILDGLSFVSGKTEKSFASKILHTLDNDKPILDSKVLQQLKKEFSSSNFSSLIKSKNKKYTLKEANVLYSTIINCYNNYLVRDAKEQNFEYNFDVFFKISPPNRITLIKKIDFYLWVL